MIYSPDNKPASDYQLDVEFHTRHLVHLISILLCREIPVRIIDYQVLKEQYLGFAL